ncbi:unnamed protein product [Brassica napus]|uniref:(rape) hypothetical protein n=1 Tax=Brassica napus TaxID=3708 RepID=A0A816TT12_BRANA|nr:unnamed protein product [Brassica napus]
MEEVVEEIEAASSSGDPHSQSLMGFVYGTGMMREKSKSKSFLRHNFAAEGENMQSKMTLAFTYMLPSLRRDLLWTKLRNLLSRISSYGDC